MPRGRAGGRPIKRRFYGRLANKTQHGEFLPSLRIVERVAPHLISKDCRAACTSETMMLFGGLFPHRFYFLLFRSRLSTRKMRCLDLKMSVVCALSLN